MDEFMKAVQDGDFVGAKAAFNSEMTARTAFAVQRRREEIAMSTAPMSDYTCDDE
ncbi:hypothetical protein phiAS5_ORF0015 [Aeromonas phage phiAS5]|uniref:Prohead core protein n=1 Tax=Aeromonas phage phiAS5 TaxID=879630 RepID=E1A2B2_9CAUD|nr:prohead [Aeromonas phage phiAS5]ADM79858.1 hypothetical protein phiAS5_ORF0015 [Aeromonas phage phiAS5]BES53036.1 hypothetical protein [Aeromonas phage phiWae14]